MMTLFQSVRHIFVDFFWPVSLLGNEKLGHWRFYRKALDSKI